MNTDELNEAEDWMRVSEDIEHWSGTQHIHSPSSRQYFPPNVLYFDLAKNKRCCLIHINCVIKQ